MRKPGAGRLAAMAVLALAIAGCSESNRSTSPVELVASATINSDVYDLAGPFDQESIEVLVRAFQRNSEAPGGAFNDVRLTEYRVSYQRTDGGTQVPPPFVVSINQLLVVGGGAEPLDAFTPVDPNSLSQAPFAALLPQNGGRDPHTGSTLVEMDVAVEVYGETLAGERVYDFARFPLDFCYGCLEF